MRYNQGTAVNSRYILQDYLGSGIFGEVWSCYDKVLDMNVAIKLFTSSDETSVIKLRSEYLSLNKISNDSICTPLNFDVSDGCPFFIYTLYRGGSIRKLVGRADEKTVWHIILDVSNAIIELQKHSLFHKNLKPENIFFSENESFVISDISLSKSTRATMSKESLERYKQAFAYKAPEVKSGSGTSEKSEIWSIGIIAFELFVGYLPKNVDNTEIKKDLSSKGISKRMIDTISSCLNIEWTARPSFEELSITCVDAINNVQNSSTFNSTIGEGKSISGTERETENSHKVYRQELTHPFVTFYEWVLVASSLSMYFIFNAYGFSNYDYLNNDTVILDDEINRLYVTEFFVLGLLCAIKVLGEILLLRKIKSGIVISTSALFLTVYVFCSISIGLGIVVNLFWSLISSGIYMAVLWVILQLRKEGQCIWKSMDSRIDIPANGWIIWLLSAATVIFLVCELLTL